MKGMGLLPMERYLPKKKNQDQGAGHFGQLREMFAPLSGAEIEGYEIHMGTKHPEGQCRNSHDKIIETASAVEKKKDGAFCGKCVRNLYPWRFR